MLSLKLYDTNLTQITAHTYSPLAFPDTSEAMFYLKNCCTHAIKAILSIDYSLSVQNFSTLCINHANIMCHANCNSFAKYLELLFVENGIYIDLANKPNERKVVTLDPDNYYRGIRDIEILFNSTAKNSNARILLSNGKFFSGIAKDNGGVAGDYDRKINYQFVEENEMIPFWLKFYTKQNMKGEVNPYNFNLVIRVDPIFDA